jgi:hypothetical protein
MNLRDCVVVNAIKEIQVERGAFVFVKKAVCMKERV